MSLVSGEGTKNGVLLALHSVYCALDVALGPGGVILGFAGGMLLFARLLPGF